MQQLHLDNYELTRMLQNQRILFRDEEAAARRAERLAATKARLESRAEQRLKVMEAAAVQEAHLQIKQLQEVIYIRGKSGELTSRTERAGCQISLLASFWSLALIAINQRLSNLLHC